MIKFILSLLSLTHSDRQLGPLVRAQYLHADRGTGAIDVAEPPKESGPHAPIVVLTDLG